MAKYENNMYSLFQTSNVFIGAFYYSKIHFHNFQDRLNRLKQSWNLYMFVRFVSSMESLSKGGHKKGTT